MTFFTAVLPPHSEASIVRLSPEREKQGGRAGGDGAAALDALIPPPTTVEMVVDSPLLELDGFTLGWSAAAEPSTVGPFVSPIPAWMDTNVWDINA